MVRLIVLRLLETYFRHRFLYLVPIGLMAIAAGLSVALTAPEYTAQGTMFVEDRSLLASLTEADSDFSWRRSPAQNVASDFSDLLRTDAFVRSAIQRTLLEQNMAQGPDAVEEAFDLFRSAISVRPIGNKLVEFSAGTLDPALSQQLVIASMDSYVLWKINADYQESIAAQNFFAALIPSYEEEQRIARDNLAMFLASYPQPVRGERPVTEEVELRRLTAAVDDATRRLEDALSKEENARLALARAENIARQTYQVLDAPELPRFRGVPLRSVVMDIAVFIAIGAVLSIVCVVGAALLDRSFLFPIDVRHGLSLPVLAMVTDARQKANAAALHDVELSNQPDAVAAPVKAASALTAQEGSSR